MDTEAKAAEAAFLAVVQTAETLQQRVAEALKPAGLTPAQYNVLRILRGAGPAGLTCGEIKARLLTRDSDVTRLLDRLEAAGLIDRRRCPSDRRQVIARLGAAGAAKLNELDEPLLAHHRATFAPLGPERLADLRASLELLRETTG